MTYGPGLGADVPAANGAGQNPSVAARGHTSRVIPITH